MGCAPIALFTYNRPLHTRQTLAALRDNELAADSDLFVFSDAAKNEAGRPLVQQVRDLVRGAQGFRSVTLIERPENLGLARSLITGVTEIVERCGEVIVLEDDLVTSRYFLRFMNEALRKYRDVEAVASVHGYIYPVRESMPDTFFLKGADCWGWATWRRAWRLFEADGAELLRQMEARKLQKAFDFGGAYPYTNMLREQVAGRNSSWAIRWYASAFLQDRLTLYPGRSLVRNIGADASGTHCDATDRFDVTLADAPVPVGDIEVRESQEAIRAFAGFFRSRPDKGAKLKNKLRKLWDRAAGNRKGRKAGYAGNYRSWQEAQRDSGGYDSGAILEKVAAALRKVRDGEAVFERDSVIFDRIEYAWPVLAGLLWIATQRGNRLRLIDFGGSLGSTYYQNIGFLRHLEELTWSIVEQENYVACGREQFANEHLKFYLDLEACLRERPCDVMLLASVLPYIEEPYRLLQAIVEKGIDFIIIDRTPLFPGREERLTVQTVPETIYRATYPAWFLSRERLLEFFAPHYELVAEFDSLVPRIKVGELRAAEQGFIFRKRGAGSGSLPHA